MNEAAETIVGSVHDDDDPPFDEELGPTFDEEPPLLLELWLDEELELLDDELEELDDELEELDDPGYEPDDEEIV